MPQRRESIACCLTHNPSIAISTKRIGLSLARSRRGGLSVQRQGGIVRRSTSYLKLCFFDEESQVMTGAMIREVLGVTVNEHEASLMASDFRYKAG